jgi:hypothetical protein
MNSDAMSAFDSSYIPIVLIKNLLFDYISFAIKLTKKTVAWYRNKRWSSWLRHYATSRKFASSIPDGVIAIFH